MRNKGLPIKGKLKEPVARSELAECTGGEGTDCTIIRKCLLTV